MFLARYRIIPVWDQRRVPQCTLGARGSSSLSTEAHSDVDDDDDIVDADKLRYKFSATDRPDDRAADRYLGGNRAPGPSSPVGRR